MTGFGEGSPGEKPSFIPFFVSSSFPSRFKRSEIPRPRLRTLTVTVLLFHPFNLFLWRSFASFYGCPLVRLHFWWKTTVVTTPWPPSFDPLFPIPKLTLPVHLSIAILLFFSEPQNSVSTSCLRFLGENPSAFFFFSSINVYAPHVFPLVVSLALFSVCFLIFATGTSLLYTCRFAFSLSCWDCYGSRVSFSQTFSLPLVTGCETRPFPFFCKTRAVRTVPNVQISFLLVSYWSWAVFDLPATLFRFFLFFVFFIFSF